MAERRNSLLDFFTSDTSDDLTYRSSMLPIGTYRGNDGRERAGLAWPQLAMDAVDAMEAVSTLDPALYPEEAQRHSGTIAGLMMGGGLAAPRPGNALAAAQPVTNTIAQSANRVQVHPGGPFSARGYHGTSHHEPVQEFNFDNFLSGEGDAALGKGIYFASKPYNAVTNNRAAYDINLENPFVWNSKAAAEIYPPAMKSYGDKQIAHIDASEAEAFAEALKQRGHDGVLSYMNGELGEIVALNPSAAKFVGRATDDGTLFSNASPSTGLMSLYGYDDQYDPFLNF